MILVFQFTSCRAEIWPLRRATCPQHGKTATWQDREVGCEFGPIDREDVINTYDDVDLGGPWLHAFALYWNTLPGFVGAWVCAAAYAKAVNGIVFDPQESLVLCRDAAVRHAQSAIDTLPQIEMSLSKSK